MRRRGSRRETRSDQPGIRGVDVIHPKTDVVEPRAVFQEPGWERMIGRERLDEWEVRIAEVEVGEADAAVVNDLGADHGEPEFIAPDFERVIGRGNCAGEVIEALVVHGRKRSMD